MEPYDPENFSLKCIFSIKNTITADKTCSGASNLLPSILEPPWIIKLEPMCKPEIVILYVGTYIVCPTIFWP